MGHAGIRRKKRAEILNGMWQNLGRNIGEYPKLEAMLRGLYSF